MYINTGSQVMNDFKRIRYAAFNLHVHIVFVTKYRRKIFGELHLKSLKQYVAEICQDFDSELKECNGESDHLHMLIEYPPTVQISKLVNSLKAVTSRRMRNDHIDLRAAYSKPVLWSRSYFAGSCGGAPLDIVKKYIQNQQG